MWIIFFFLLGSPDVGSNIDTFSWLKGTWEMKKKNGTSRLEVWTKHDDNTLIGKGLKVSGSDTTELESIKLVFQDEDFWYVPTVPDQNNAMPVKFKLVSQEGFKYIFENPQHDFPQRIIYDYQPLSLSDVMICHPGDKMLVKVETMDGTNSIPFEFIRK